MTSTTSGTEVVLKADELGRVRTPIARRQSLLEEFERSGLSGTKFAALAGVKYSTFAGWLQKQRHKNGNRGRGKGQADGATQVRWLETVIEQAQNPSDKGRVAIVVQLPGGASVEIATAGQARLAAELLSMLEKPTAAC